MPQQQFNLDPALSAANPTMLVALLEEMGFAKQEILENTDISPEQLSDYRNILKNSQYQRLILNALKITNNPALGLLYGNRLNFTGHNILGLGLLASETFWEVINFIKSGTIAIEPSIAINASRDSDYVHIGIEEAAPWGETHRFLMDTAITLFHVWVSLFDPNMAKEIIFHLDFPEPADSEIYNQHIEGKIVFDSPIRRISIPTSFCDRLLPLRNPAACEQAKGELQRLLDRIENPSHALLIKIKSMLSVEFGKFPTIDEVAENLHMTPRTLNRRLSAIGTSFKDIVAGVRKQHAIESLYNNKLSVDEIAYQLGYSDPSNFSKAFRKWTGYSPSQYKAKFTTTENYTP